MRLDLQEKQVLTDWMFQHHLGISPRPSFVELRDGLNVLATQMSQAFGKFTPEEWYNKVVDFYNNNISKTEHRARLGNFIRQAEHVGQDVTQAEILGLYEAGQLHDFELICLRRSAWFSSRAPNPFNPVNVIVEDIGAPSEYEALCDLLPSPLPQDPEAADLWDVFEEEEEV